MIRLTTRDLLGLILVVAISSGSALAAAYTSAKTGDWNNKETWKPQGIPAEGDTVTLANGNTVTIPASYAAVVGASSVGDKGSVPAIQCESAEGTGVLIINGILRFRGDIQQANATWTAGAGAVIEHDSSKAEKPASTGYTWQIGMAKNQPDAVLKLSGTGRDKARVTIRNAEGSGRFGGFQGGGRIDARWATFLGLGPKGGDPKSSDCIAASLEDAKAAFVLEDCLFDGCTQVTVLADADVASFRLLRTSFLNTAATGSASPLQISAKSRLAKGAERRIEDCVITGSCRIANGFDISFIRNVITSRSDAPPMTFGGYFTGGQFDDNLIWNVGPRGTTFDVPRDVTTHRLISIRGKSGDNDHLRCMRPGGFTVDGAVLERIPGTPASGAVFIVGCRTDKNLQKIVLKNIVDVPTATGTADGKLHPAARTLCTAMCGTGNRYNGDGTQTAFGPVTLETVTNVLVDGKLQALGTDYTVNGKEVTFKTAPKAGQGNVVLWSCSCACRISIENCTRIGDDTNFVSLFGLEQTVGHADIVQKIANNLLWSDKVVRGVLTSEATGHTGTTAMPKAIVMSDYNALWNIKGKTDLLHDEVYANPPGKHNLLDVDPEFVDSGRNLLKWGQQFLPSIKDYDEVLAQIIKKNDDSGHDRRFSHLDYYTWVREGFAPRNLKLASGGESNGYFGAVQPIAGRATQPVTKP